MTSAKSNRELVLAALDTFESRLFRYALRMLRDEHAARDAVQHTFLKLLDAEHDDAFESRMGQWLFTVCRNRVMDLLRQRQRETTSPLGESIANEHLANGHANVNGHRGVQGERDSRFPTVTTDHDYDPATQAEAADMYQQVQKAMNDLPEGSREPLALWAEGFTYREIAEILKQNESSLRVVVHRALMALKSHPLLQKALT